MPRRLLSDLLLVLSAVFALGCLPIPHWRRASPGIDGSVYTRDQPVAGVRVALSREENVRVGDECRDTVQETRTNDSGAFHLRATFSFMPVMLLPEDISPRWIVCVETGGTLKAASVTRVGGDAPSDVRMTCNATDTHEPTGHVECRYVPPTPSKIRQDDP